MEFDSFLEKTVKRYIDACQFIKVLETSSTANIIRTDSVNFKRIVEAAKVCQITKFSNMFTKIVEQETQSAKIMKHVSDYE